MTPRDDAERLIREALRELADRSALRRLWQGDASLWTDDPAEQAVCRDRLGWLRVADAMVERVPELEAFAASVRADGIRHVVLCGMGGSSLAAEVLASVFPPEGDTPSLTVLDTTDPVRIAAAERGLDLTRALFLVSSKSGTTIETDCLRAYFAERVAGCGVEDVGSRFVAISDPGSSLVRLAREQQYRAVFENPPDIGGRYSALSLFGLVPAVLLGIDLTRLLAAASTEATECAPGRNPSESPGAAVNLAAAMGGLARAGIDKLALLCSPSLEPFGAWAEQLVAESTGKHGLGVVPVVGSAADGDDRCYVRIRLADEDCAPAPAGAPTRDCVLRDRSELGALFFRFEMATALASALLGVEPFDQRDVAAAKRATADVLAGGGGDPVAADDVAGLRDFLASARAGDYVALLSFLPGVCELPPDLVEAVERVAGVSVTPGTGPRYLHSTGQLHKGGPNTAVVVLLEADVPDGADLAIPGRDFTLGELFAAQAEGDARTLVERGRRFLRLRLEGDVPTALANLVRSLS